MLSECKPFRLGSKEVQIQDPLEQCPFEYAGERFRNIPEREEQLTPSYGMMEEEDY
jgi:hypothetical protein